MHGTLYPKPTKAWGHERLPAPPDRDRVANSVRRRIAELGIERGALADFYLKREAEHERRQRELLREIQSMSLLLHRYRRAVHEFESPTVQVQAEELQ